MSDGRQRTTASGISAHLGDATRAVDAGSGALGAGLKNARVARGMELADIAELTHVRKEYLRALEEGRYGDLPEDVYTRNFVKLFAQAVGLDPENAMAAYQSERKQAGGLSTLEMRLENERKGEPPPKRSRSSSTRRPGIRIGPALPTLLLVIALVALAVWGFNRLLFRTDRGPTQTQSGSPSSEPASAPPVLVPDGAATQSSDTAAGAGVAGAASSQQSGDQVPRTVLISVVSDPPGATVSIDSFVLPGTTPITDAPVTARSGRIFNVSLDGYQTLEQAVDLLENQTVTVTLAPLAAATDAQPQAAAAQTAADGELLITVRASTWLEVYTGTARNQGERLVYRTADPGETFRFELPVYVHVGNAAGVDVTIGDVAIGALGSSGAVVGRAFTGQ